MAENRAWVSVRRFFRGHTVCGAGAFRRHRAARGNSRQENPPNNAYPLYLQAAQQADQDGDRIGAAVSPRPKEAQQWNLARRTRLRNAHTGELSLARRGFPLPYSDLNSSRTVAQDLPNYAKFRTLVRLFLLDGDIKRDQGNLLGAAQSYSDAVVFGNALTHGAPITGFETAMMCQNVGRVRLWKLLPAMDAKTGRKTLRRLNNPSNNSEAFVQTLTEEKYALQTKIVAFYHDVPRFSPMNAIWGRRTVMNNGTDYMDAVIADARAPFSLHKETPLPSDLLNQILVPITDRARFGSVAGDTQNALLTTTLALHAFRAEHNGASPPTLSALVPAYLPSVPLDPFAYPAAPLSYTKNGAKTILWSVGPDNVNNHGTPTRDYKPTSGPAKGDYLLITTPTSKGDIVAGINTRFW